MLIQFTVENYLSIRDKVFLSLEPSTDQEHPENIVTHGTYSGMSSITVYGANASGKSSLFKAITTAIIMVRNSNALQVTSKLPVVPFKFDEESLEQPSSFEFVFVAADGLKYVYGFSATQDEIIEEYLYCYKSVKPSLVFDRQKNQEKEYKFPRSSRVKMEAASKMNTPNKLFLPTATSWNVEETKAAYEWIAGAVDTFSDTSQLISNALSHYVNDADHSIQDFTQILLKEADINIRQMSVTSRKVSDSSPFPVEGIMINGNFVKPDPEQQYEIRIQTEHNVKRKDGSIRTVALSLEEESRGTQQLIFFGPFLKETFDNGKTLIIDEIDSSLHPFIVKYLIDLFRNKDINPNGAQLIVTTHETTLLSLDTFRRDQIYFTEKDAGTGVTDLYSLDEYSVRKGENIQRGYLLGRYGAIPFLQTEGVF